MFNKVELVEREKIARLTAIPASHTARSANGIGLMRFAEPLLLFEPCSGEHRLFPKPVMIVTIRFRLQPQCITPPCQLFARASCHCSERSASATHRLPVALARR
jgi:hypothetical protein